MHLPAGVAHAPLVGFEIEVEVLQRMVLDVARSVAQRIELGQALRHLAPTRDEVHLDELQRLLQARVRECVARIVLEVRRRDVFGHGGDARASPRRTSAASTAVARASPIAGASVMPASTSATWRA